MKQLNSLLFAGLSLLVAGLASAVEPADYVFTGAKVYTVDDRQPWAEAVAVKGNKLVYVGDAAGVKSFVGEKTEVFDIPGKTILPGFVSGHDHLVGAGWLLAGVKLTDARNQEELLKRVKEYADANPDLKYILGNGWNFEQFEARPTAAMLEANPLEADPMQIEEIDVTLTMVDGKIKYRIDQAPEDVYPADQPRVSTGAYR